jgi:RNA polymerase sigma-70 factor (ECF subfamily)
LRFDGFNLNEQGLCVTSEAAISVKRSSAEANAAMDRYAAGQDAAFITVYDALAPRLMAYLLRRADSPADAADLLQETMLHVHRARSDFIAGAAVAPWAFAIARRLLADRRRQRHQGPMLDSDILEAQHAESPSADEVVQAHELAELVESTLAGLPPRQRVAFELIRRDGLSFDAAARTLGTTVGAAKLRLHRAYETLRSALSAREARELRARR